MTQAIFSELTNAKAPLPLDSNFTKTLFKISENLTNEPINSGTPIMRKPTRIFNTISVINGVWKNSPTSTIKEEAPSHTIRYDGSLIWYRDISARTDYPQLSALLKTHLSLPPRLCPTQCNTSCSIAMVTKLSPTRSRVRSQQDLLLSRPGWIIDQIPS